MSSRSSSKARDHVSYDAGPGDDQKRRQDRKRNTVVVVQRFLTDSGYSEAAAALAATSGVSLNEYEVCDNIDLQMIIQDWEQFYEMKFSKKPRLIRKLSADERARAGQKLPRIPQASANLSQDGQPPANTAAANTAAANTAAANGEASGEDFFDQRILKPVPDFGGNAEMRELAGQVTREIYRDSPNVRFDDVAASEATKRLLREAVVLPLRFPGLFRGLLTPWRGVLLFGPPGTGKTMLAKAVATECETTFFNISASSVVSKWRGDSEKLVRVLFELARYHSPATIFLDELDSLMMSRDGAGEHEASRRMKTELLIQMDGLSQGSEMVLRRFEKRILVPTPNAENRARIFGWHLRERVDEGSVNFEELAAETEGYSGADIVQVSTKSV